MSWLSLVGVSFAIVISSLSPCSLAEPKVLTSYSLLVAYAGAGVPILIRVDIDKCTHDFPKNLQPYSFTERLDFFILTDSGISFNRETSVNGTRLKLVGPATRVLEMNLEPSGLGNFRISDIVPSTGQVVTSGTIACRIGAGLTPIAGAKPGSVLVSFTEVLDTLEAGYRVYVVGDLRRCQQFGHPKGQKINVGSTMLYGEVVDHRIGKDGSVTFSKQTPVLEAGGLSHGYGDAKLNPDESIDVFYYVFRPSAQEPPVRLHWKCQLKDSFNYVKQS